MDRDLFTESMTGRLLEIREPFKDVAFIPDPLPSEWSPSATMVELLIDAMSELGRLDGRGIHIQNPDLILRPLSTRESLTSSSLEGTYASAEQLILFEESGPREPAPDSVAEVHNYSQALELGIELLRNELPFCLRLIREMHARLLQGGRGTDLRRGEFRDQQVHIGSDRRFVPPPPSELRRLLDEFEDSMHRCPEGIRPLVWAFMVHYQFEAIHPFHDGNGRVGRLLLSLMIADGCELSQPWLYMSPWFERYKDEYIDKLFRVSRQGAWDDWLEFCLRGVIHQARDAVTRLDALIALKQDYLARVGASGGSARLGTIVNRLFHGGPVTTVPALAAELSVTYPTAKADIDRLIALQILTPLSKRGRSQAFAAWEIVRIGIDANAGK